MSNRVYLEDARNRHVINATHEAILRKEGFDGIKDFDEKSTSIHYSLNSNTLEEIFEKALRQFKYNKKFLAVTWSNNVAVVISHFFKREEAVTFIADVNRELQARKIPVQCVNCLNNHDDTLWTRELQIYVFKKNNRYSY